MRKEDLKDYDELECPVCGKICKPTNINSKNTVSYTHLCTNGMGFKIDENGDLID